MDCRNKSYGQRLNEKASAWKGDDVSYSGIHKWVYDKFGTPTKCEKCGIEGGGKNMNWANVSGEYKRDRSDWVRLCPRCHRLYDNIKKRI